MSTYLYAYLLRFDSVGSNCSKFLQTIPPLSWMDAEIVNSSTDNLERFSVKWKSIFVGRNESWGAPACRVVIVPGDIVLGAGQQRHQAHLLINKIVTSNQKINIVYLITNSPINLTIFVTGCRQSKILQLTNKVLLNMYLLISYHALDEITLLDFCLSSLHKKTLQRDYVFLTSNSMFSHFQKDSYKVFRLFVLLNMYLLISYHAFNEITWPDFYLLRVFFILPRNKIENNMKNTNKRL